MIKASFYESDDDEVPLGEEYWIVAVPRCGDTVTLEFTRSGEPSKRSPFTGGVVSVQWTFEPTGSDRGPDYCTVDITLRELRGEAPTPAEPGAAAAESGAEAVR